MVSEYFSSLIKAILGHQIVNKSKGLTEELLKQLRFGVSIENNGWIQTLLREIVKNRSYVNLTSYSKTASKIRPACEI